MRIIYIDVDTLRADHTTPYGYHRPTTPNLQRLADKSVTFDRYYCSDSPCLPSRTALTSGQFGISNGVIGHFGPAAQFRLDAGHGPEPDRPLLGQRLGWGGYYTAAISVFAERHRAYFFHGNFRESIRATDRFGDEEAPDVTRAAIDWLRRHADEDDWYLHLTYWDPHTNYTQPAEWTERMAASGPVQAWPDEETIAAHAEVYGPRSALDLHYSLMGAGTSPVPHNMPDAIRSRADSVAGGDRRRHPPGPGRAHPPRGAARPREPPRRPGPTAPISAHEGVHRGDHRAGAGLPGLEETAGAWTTIPGPYRIEAGRSVTALRVSAVVQVGG